MKEESAKPTENVDALEEIKHEGQQYVLIDVAAKRAQVSLKTLVRWADQGVTNCGLHIGIVRDPENQALYISKQSVETLANRFQPVDVSAFPEQSPRQLEWRVHPDKSVEYGGKVYHSKN